jgi:hypothetical protein
MQQRMEQKNAVSRLEAANLELYNIIAAVQREIITMVRTAPGLTTRPFAIIDNFKNILGEEHRLLHSHNLINEAYLKSLNEQNVRLISVQVKLVDAKSDLKILLPKMQRKIENILKDKVVLKTEADQKQARGDAMVATRNAMVEFLDQLIKSFPQQNATNTLAIEHKTPTKRR